MKIKSDEIINIILQLTEFHEEAASKVDSKRKVELLEAFKQFTIENKMNNLETSNLCIEVTLKLLNTLLMSRVKFAPFKEQVN